MFRYKTLLVLCLASLLMATAAAPAERHPSLQLEISNVQRSRGQLIVALYKDKSSWLQTTFRKTTIASDAASKAAVFAVPHGRYAVSIFQDINGNGELDQNFLGIPKEPVGFGNNYKPLGKPAFESALIEHSATSRQAAIKLFTVL